MMRAGLFLEWKKEAQLCIIRKEKGTDTRSGNDMKYTTTDELEHFSFTETYIADVQVTGGFFHMTLSNVTILPENSCNRDIREMRANDLVLKIKEPVIRSLVREGYKVYDANGTLLRTCEDEVIDQAAWNETIRSFADGTLYALKQDGENYVFEIDAPDEEEYVLAVSGTHNTASWDRFLNK